MKQLTFFLGAFILTSTNVSAYEPRLFSSDVGFYACEVYCGSQGTPVVVTLKASSQSDAADRANVYADSYCKNAGFSHSSGRSTTPDGCQKINL